MLRELKLTSLDDFDNGRIAVAFNQALKRCTDDCHDRPGVKEARTLTLQVNVIPVCGEAGDLDTVDLIFQIKDKAPTRKSKTYNLECRRNGSLVYNDLAPDNARQMTIDQTCDADQDEE